MVRKRADPWYKEADRNYPIKVKFHSPGSDWYKQNLGQEPHRWLQANLGPKMWDWGPADFSGLEQATAYYFRRLEDAERFVAAFPHLRLADKVAAPIDTTPAEPTPHLDFSQLSRGWRRG